MTKVKLGVHYGKAQPGDVVDIKDAEAKHLIETRQAKAVEEPSKPEEKKSRKAGEGNES